MLATSGLNGYESTLDFVNELKNHLSIAKICENDELRNCWPTEKVKLNNRGEEWEISRTKTPQTIKMKNSDFMNWDNTVGIITGDGTPMILSYNKNCDIDPVSTPSWDVNKSSSTSCIAAIFDWNGGRKPNQFKEDVLALNANGLSTECAIGFGAGGKCFGAPFKPSILERPDCEQIRDDLGMNFCGWSDYWAGVVKQCGGVTNVVSLDDLGMIASQIYVGNPRVPELGDVTSLTYIEGSATSMGLPEPSFWVWSSSERSSDNIHVRTFGPTGTYFRYKSRYEGEGLGICVLD